MLVETAAEQSNKLPCLGTHMEKTGVECHQFYSY